MTGETAQAKRGISNPVAIGLLLIFVIVIDVFAFLLFPPFDKEAPGVSCEFPVCYINGNLEFPAPHTVWSLDGAPASPDLITFQVSLSSTLLTMFIITIVVIVLLWLLSRKHELNPGRARTRSSTSTRCSRTSAPRSAARRSKPYIPLFVGFFLFILFCNWSGLIPPIGKVEALRAPTSDLNVTIGLALVAFVFIEYQGFKHLGVGYLSKFFPFGEFKKGAGAGRSPCSSA